jgi:hypothetical protein
MFTTLLPYLPYVFRFVPDQVFGFNLTGWAWMLMLIVALFNLFFTRNIPLPLVFWIPWVVYLVGYLIYDFSFLGLQLTLQYSLPLIVGIVASGFIYAEEELEWLFSWFVRLCAIIISMFIIGYLFRGGFTPASAATPMLLTILFSFLIGFYFYTKNIRMLVAAFILFSVPIIDNTRMGVAAMAAIFIIHFSNTNIIQKLFFGSLGLIIFIMVFNSKRFQEKTFISGNGTLQELTFNYYDNPNMRITGRISWKKALDPGLEQSPVWGNGPRADFQKLVEVTGYKTGEAHNDYLSVRYNYGYAGLSLLLAGFVFTFIYLFRIFGNAGDQNYLWLMTASVLPLFFGFLMFMYTDNILKYTIYFPNYFFALIGIISSINKDEDYSSYSAVQ